MISIVTWRKVAAVGALAVLGIMVAAVPTPHPSNAKLVWALRVLLIPVVATVVAILDNKAWGRWVGIALGLAVVPWAGAFALTAGIDSTRPLLALGAALVLLGSLSGRRMVDRFETSTMLPDSNSSLVRWTVIANIASMFVLYLFVVGYEYRVGWRIVIPGGFLILLGVGVVLLARGKTAGLLLVAATCVSIVPAGGYFVWREATSWGEGLLLVSAVLPGLCSGWASLFVFGKPVWRYLDNPASNPNSFIR